MSSVTMYRGTKPDRGTCIILLQSSGWCGDSTCIACNKCLHIQEYADNVFINFIPHLESQLRDTKRVDVVWDEYRPDSLKEGNREKKRVRRKVLGDTKLPGNWNVFLRDPINRKELFEFLSSKVAIAASLLKCPAALRKKQTLGLWFTCSMLWRMEQSRYRC